MDHHRGTFGVFKGDPVIMGESHKIWMQDARPGRREGRGRRRGGGWPPLWIFPILHGHLSHHPYLEPHDQPSNN